MGVTTEKANDQARWDLPQDWKWKRANEFAKVIGGGTPKNASDSSNFADDGTPWVTPADLTGYTKATIYEGRRSLSEAGLRNSSARILPRGTVLISSRAPVGYCAIAGGEITTNQGFRSLVCDDSIDPFFIRYYVLLSRRYLEDNASGTTFKELSGSALGSLLFPVPPLETQRRIVARIDELFSELDDGEEELARARADLKTYRKALLKAAVNGELTADWRASKSATETGADLLARIAEDRRTGWDCDARNGARRYSEPALLASRGDHALPIGWSWASIEQLTTGGIRNGLSLKEATNPTKVKALRLDGLQDDGIDWTRTRYLPITFDRAQPYLLRSGDLLISRANGSPDFVGRCSLVTDAPGDTIFPDTAIRYPIWGDMALWNWVRTAWSSPQSRTAMLKLAKTTAGILKISQGDIAAVPLPVPPLEEIVEIGARMKRLADEVEAGAVDLERMERAAFTLRQSILAAAFRGELVQ